MSGQCFGSDDAENGTREAEESAPAGAPSVPCTEDKVMYFNISDNGWWRVRRGTSTSGPVISLPQHLKVLVNGPRSCQGERYYFTILEGPLVNNGVHVRTGSAGMQGSVVKVDGGTPTLVEQSPHIAAADITMVHSSHEALSYGGYAVPSVEGHITYAGVRKLVRMQADLVPPNTPVKIMIPDAPHDPHGYNARLATMWLRIDATTSPVNFTGGGVGNDRYFHLGRGSAGCFTNVYSGSGRDTDYDTIIDELTKARDNSELYVGQITLQMSDADYQDLRRQVIARARADGTDYVWEGAVRSP